MGRLSSLVPWLLTASAKVATEYPPWFAALLTQKRFRMIPLTNTPNVLPSAYSHHDIRTYQFWLHSPS